MAAPQEIIEVDRTPKASRESRWSADLPDDRNYIAVSGNMGTGKSSLVEFLCQQWDFQPFFEPNAGNPYLEDFYADMSRWSFHSQVHFLTAKFKLHLEMDESPHDVIQDRTIWEDAEIFAENLLQRGRMSEREYETYRQLYESIQDRIRAPDLMLYLHCPVETIQKRIEIRGREMEKDVPEGYLAQLQGLYEDWIDSYSLSPIVIIPTHKLDYMTNLVERHDIIKTIEKYIAA
ncbi:MAG: deoxynucleoside kinase [Bradymonadaceae bacterium]